jgi:hypothetical protein
MLENRSFDNVLGWLYEADTGISRARSAAGTEHLQKRVSHSSCLAAARYRHDPAESRVMSPWIPKGTIGNDQYDHTSIIRTVCSRFLPAGTHLGARDAQARDLGALLTATSARTDLPTLQPRTPPPFDPTKLATAPLTDFQKQLLALGLQSMQSQYPEAVAQAGAIFETHADAWRIMDLFPQS